MAQHYSILKSPEKGFQKVAESMRKRLSRGVEGVCGSLKFEEIPQQDCKMNPNDRVFTTMRTVNGERELFELHYDTKEGKLLEIYFVK